MKFHFLVAFCLFSFFSKAQSKREYIEMTWPEEYNWKVIDQSNANNIKSVIIIPGNETPKYATIVGTLKAFMGTHFSTLPELINFYKNSIDSATKFTLLSSSDTVPKIWVIFKVETPRTKKYPQSESDLYYAIQGESALYEYSVAVRQPFITESFVNKWTQVFSTATISIK